MNDTTKQLSLSLLVDGLPRPPSEKIAAQCQNDQITAVSDYLEQVLRQLSTRFQQNQRIINGDAANDSFMQEQYQREAAKWRKITTGEDEYSKWNRERAAINAARDEENSRRGQEARQGLEAAREQTLRMIR